MVKRPVRSCSRCALLVIGIASLASVGGASAPAVRSPSATVRVAGVVLKWVEADRPANYRRAERLIREAAANGARIVATPESFLDGYAVRNPDRSVEELRDLAEPVPAGPYFVRLQALVDELDIYLVAAITELAGLTVYNSAVLLGPDGALVGRYRKNFVWPGEARLYAAGQELPVFDTPYGKVGIMICFDRMHPAGIRELARRGADLVFNPSGGSWGPKSDSIVSRRSREGRVPIVFVHPAEFLVTGADGSVLTSAVYGDEVDDPDSTDSGAVSYFDLPIDR